MGNSPLVTCTKISPNRTSPRNHVIDTVTIHCVVGQCTASTIVNFSHFTNYNSSGGASCNYAVGNDGSIGLCVEEKDRSWCSSNRANDHRAITIEVASDTKHPYAITDAAYKALIDLLVDICQRNPGIGTLKWKGDKSLIGQTDKQNMTVHRWFASKACPGDYLYNLHGQIAAEVNARLGVTSTVESRDDIYAKGKSKKLSTNFKSTEFDCQGKGCCSETVIDDKLVEYLQKIRTHFGKPVNVSSGYRCATHNKNVGGATGSYHAKGQAADIYINGVAPAEIAKYAESIGILGIGLYETAADGYFVHVDTRTSKSFWYGQAQQHRDTFGGTTEKVETATKPDFEPYKVSINTSVLNIRKGPGTNYDRIGFTGKGIFTIVDEADGVGASKWGLLSSFKDKRNGWVSLAYCKKI